MKNRLRFTALALACTIPLGACTGELVADAPESGQSTPANPNLDAPRISEVLASVDEALKAADAANDATQFNGRLAGGAERTRKAQYELAKASGATVEALDLTAENTGVTNSAAWPRLILNIRRGDTADLPMAEVFVQNDARSSYALVNYCRLLGGTELTIPSVEEGSAFLTEDSQGFIMTPKEALDAYVEMLNTGATSSESYAADQATAQYQENAKNLSAALAAAGSVTANAQVPDLPINGVVLHDGSALVAANLTFTHTYQRTVAGSKMRLGGQTATLNAGDEDAVKGTAVATYIGTLLIRIPTAAQGGVAQVVGADWDLESVSLDESTDPDVQH